MKTKQDQAFASLVASGYLSSSGHIAITGNAPYCSTRNNWNDTNVADLEVMAALPPCTYWQRRADGPNKRMEWVSRIEGNPKLGAPSEARLRHLMKTDAGVFFEVTDDMAAALNLGPERRETFQTRTYPQAAPYNVTLTCGLPGSSFAPARLAPKGEHGSSDERSAEDYLRSRSHTASSDTREASPGRDALAEALRRHR